MQEDVKELLQQIARRYKEILKENLVGIYVHGSIAFQCFYWDKSDIDFIVVTESVPTLSQKIHLIQVLLDLDSSLPPKGAEMSLILKSHCQNFVYPTPFALHFSNAHKKACRTNLREFCHSMNGVDKDLAAHFTVLQTAGILLTGESIPSVFAPVPHWAYVDSIQTDIRNAKDEILKDPVYVILNLCRILAYQRESLILSKLQGGYWGIKSLSPVYTKLIQTAIHCYQSCQAFSMPKNLLQDFANDMLRQIFICNR